MDEKKPKEEVVEDEYDYSLRYDEFIAPMIKVIQDLSAKVEQLESDKLSLESRIEALESIVLNGKA